MIGEPEPQASLVRRALAGHAAIGLLAGALLYIISLTGSLAVIHDRWQRWEQPDVAETAMLAPAAAQAAIGAAIAAEAGQSRTTHLYLRMPTAALPRAVVTTDRGGWYVDATGRIVAREENGWTEFIIGLHEYLHLPATLGMIVVGALGVALVALLLTGVLAHPRIVRDAFRLRTRSDPQIARADWHNRLGVWTLPFALAVALTGAFIGLGSVGFTALARAYTGGDLEQIYAPVFGREPTANPAPAPLPDIATALRTLAIRAPGTSPTYVIVHDPATRGQHVQILAEHPRRLIYGESYAFDAHGRWRGAAGLAGGAIGQQIAASTYNLHFGNYGGIAVELGYMLFGFALCGITATGISLWLQKRSRRGLESARLSAGWTMIVWGSPLLMVWLLWLRLIAGTATPLAAGFWGGLAAGLVLAIVRPGAVSAPALRRTLWLSIGVTALAHLLLFRPTPAGTIAIDCSALLIALAAIAIDRRAPPEADKRRRGVFGRMLQISRV